MGNVFCMVDARWLTGGVGGFLFDGCVLRTKFWMNPPLRWYLLGTAYQFYYT
jgi:hypothetical protein